MTQLSRKLLCIWFGDPATEVANALPSHGLSPHILHILYLLIYIKYILHILCSISKVYLLSHPLHLTSSLSLFYPISTSIMYHITEPYSSHPIIPTIPIPGVSALLPSRPRHLGLLCRPPWHGARQAHSPGIHSYLYQSKHSQQKENTIFAKQSWSYKATLLLCTLCWASLPPNHTSCDEELQKL